MASGWRVPQEGDRVEDVVVERKVADARDRVRDCHGSQGVVRERTFADARDCAPDRHAGEGVASERIFADARD